MSRNINNDAHKAVRHLMQKGRARYAPHTPPDAARAMKGKDGAEGRPKP